ncbi:hypothetical protein ColKHC_11245 [Colletotrichum higginsianum]|nr:hypothetical protein ColKHC_11245 [Colletotrichum higginsianum]
MSLVRSTEDGTHTQPPWTRVDSSSTSAVSTQKDESCMTRLSPSRPRARPCVTKADERAAWGKTMPLASRPRDEPGERRMQAASLGAAMGKGASMAKLTSKRESSTTTTPSTTASRCFHIMSVATTTLGEIWRTKPRDETADLAVRELAVPGADGLGIRPQPGVLRDQGVDAPGRRGLLAALVRAPVADEQLGVVPVGEEVDAPTAASGPASSRESTARPKVLVRFSAWAAVMSRCETPVTRRPLTSVSDKVTSMSGVLKAWMHESLIGGRAVELNRLFSSCGSSW